MQRPIYMDYNATTPVDPAAVEAMLPYLSERFGNASSGHLYGYEAHGAMERARRHVASLLGARAHEVVFTGGGSETNNLAIKGTVFARLQPGSHIISTVSEHPAVLNVLSYLKARFGVEHTLVPVDGFGLVDPDGIRKAIRPQTVLVTVMHANNEVGTIQPITDIARVTREAGVTFHVDAAQAVGKIGTRVEDLGVDLLTLAGHKVYGPKGIGVLCKRAGVVLDPLIHGSGQEVGLRAGTENVASMVGLGAACSIAKRELATETEHLTALRDRLHERLMEEVPGLALNGHPKHRLPNTLNVSFPGVLGQSVLASAPEVAASTGSACHSGRVDPSPVLLAMGLPVERALGAVRLSLGRWTTEEEVERASQFLAEGFRLASAQGAAAGVI